MKTIRNILVLFLASLALVACGTSQTPDTAKGQSSEQTAPSGQLKSKVASAFSLNLEKVKENGTTTLSSGDIKHIYTYEGTMFGNIEKDGKIFSMYAGNRLRNDLMDKAEQLGLASVSYPVSEFHSDIDLGFAGARLIVLLKEDNQENQQAVLDYLQETYGTDLSQSISFTETVAADFLDKETAIWID